MTTAEALEQIAERLRRREADPVAFAQMAASDIAFLLALVRERPATELGSSACQ